MEAMSYEVLDACARQTGRWAEKYCRAKRFDVLADADDVAQAVRIALWRLAAKTSLEDPGLVAVVAKRAAINLLRTHAVSGSGFTRYSFRKRHVRVDAAKCPEPVNDQIPGLELFLDVCRVLDTTADRRAAQIYRDWLCGQSLEHGWNGSAKAAAYRWMRPAQTAVQAAVS